MIETVKQSKDSKRKLPNGWRRVKLGEVCRIQNGFAFDSDKFDATVGVPLIRIRDLKTNNPSIRYSGDFDKVYLVRAGDLLIGMDGEFRAYRWQGLDALLNQRVCRLFHDMDQVAIGYIHYLLDEYLQDIEEVTTYTTVKHLSSRDIEAISIPLPPLTEQHRIADVLHEQMKAVDKARAAAMSRLDAVKALPAAFLRQIFPQSGQTLSAGWRWVRLGDIANTTSGSTPPRSCAHYYEGSIPWIKTGQLCDGDVDQADEYVTQQALDECSLPLLPPDTLLIAMYGQGQTRGRTGLLRMYATINQACFAILPNKQEFNSRFLMAWFCHSYERIRSETESRGGNQPNLNGQILKDMKLPLPPLAEQRRITGVIKEQMSAVDKARAAAEEELYTIKALPAALLRRAFNGEI